MNITLSVDRFRALYKVYMLARKGSSEELKQAVQACRQLENSELLLHFKIGIPSSNRMSRT